MNTSKDLPPGTTAAADASATEPPLHSSVDTTLPEVDTLLKLPIDLKLRIANKDKHQGKDIDLHLGIALWTKTLLNPTAVA